MLSLFYSQEFLGTKDAYNSVISASAITYAILDFIGVARKTFAFLQLGS